MSTYPTIALQPGSTNTAEVKKLQDYLVSVGYMTQAQVNTGYGTYGPQTTAAVLALQKTLGVDYSTGPGYWGPRTLTAVQSQSKTTAEPQRWSDPIAQISYEGEQRKSTDIPLQRTTTIPPPVIPTAPTAEPQRWSDPTTQQSYEGPQRKSTDVPLNDAAKATVTTPTVEPELPEPPELPGYDTGNEDLNAILTSIQDVLTSIIDSGKIINPKIDITPERLVELTDQVTKELDPYYKSQFEAIRDDLQADLGYLSEQYSQVVKGQEAQFKQTLGAQRETEAGAGTIFSGGRRTREQALAEAGQRSMEGLTSALGYQAQKIGTATERTLGSTALAGLPLSRYAPYSVSPLGEGQYIPISDRTLFAPAGGITGTLEREQIEKKRSYLDLLKQAELEKLNV